MKRTKMIIVTALVIALSASCLTACSSSDSSAAEDTDAEVAETESTDTDTEAAESTETEAAAAGGAAVTVSDEEFAQYLTEVKTNQYFMDEAVADEDIETILKAGINAQSGMNQQNWHFSAVTSKEVQQEIADDMGLDTSDPYSKAMIADAPLAIIVSYGEGAGTEYDAGLATQNMNAAALALGYATKIISSPQYAINAEEKQDYYHDLLGIPEEMSVVGVLLVGMPLDTSTFEDQDAVTAATTRNSYSDMTTIVD